MKTASINNTSGSLMQWINQTQDNYDFLLYFNEISTVKHPVHQRWKCKYSPGNVMLLVFLYKGNLCSFY